MNKWLERAIIFAVGAGVGSSAIYLGLRNKLEQSYSDKLEAAIVREQEAYHIAKKKLELDKEEKEDIREETEKFEEITAFYKPPLEELIINYDKVESKVEEVEMSQPLVAPEPYFITIDDFAEREDFDSVTIRHYNNDVYSYDDGDLIYQDEIEKLLGNCYLDTLNHGNLADICYIRNERMERDYEVTRQYMTYDEAFGMSEPRRIGG